MKEANLPTKFVIPFMRDNFFVKKIFTLFPNQKPNQILSSETILGFCNSDEVLQDVIRTLHDEFGTDESVLKKCFSVHDCFLSNPLLILENSNEFFLFSNPTVATRSICEKKLGEEITSIYFKDTELDNLFEIAIDLYSKYDGAWFVPYSFLISQKNTNLRKKILGEHSKHFSSITVYDSESADIFNLLYCSFVLSAENSAQPSLNISFLNHPPIKVEIDWDGTVCPEWHHIMKLLTPSNIKTHLEQGFREDSELYATSCNLKKSVCTKIQVDDKTFNTISSNYLFAQLQDKSSSSLIKLLNKKELIAEFDLNITEDTPLFIDNSVKYVYPIYFLDSVNIDTQEEIKNRFNKKLSEMRLQFNSLFLSNVVNSNSKKKITINEAVKFIAFIQKNIQ